MTFKILRFEPQKDEYPHSQLFRHEPQPQDSVLEALKDIRDQEDPSLSFRYSCREAVCGSCSMVVNGRISLACRTQVSDLGSDMEHVFQYITCILCAGCYSACPVATRDGRYARPAALAKLYRFAIDPRDRRPFSALERVDGPDDV